MASSVVEVAKWRQRARLRRNGSHELRTSNAPASEIDLRLRRHDNGFAWLA